MVTTPTPSPWSTIPAFTTPVPEGTCDRAMDLAFLLDGSTALTENEFNALKEFILRVVDRFRMGSAHTRATVLRFHSGVKTYDLQVDDLIMHSHMTQFPEEEILSYWLYSALTYHVYWEILKNTATFHSYRFRSGFLRRPYGTCITQEDLQPSLMRLSSIWPSTSTTKTSVSTLAVLPSS